MMRIMSVTHLPQTFIFNIHSFALNRPQLTQKDRKLDFQWNCSSIVILSITTMSMTFLLNLSGSQLSSDFQHTCSLIILVLSTESPLYIICG